MTPTRVYTVCRIYEAEGRETLDIMLFFNANWLSGEKDPFRMIQKAAMTATDCSIHGRHTDYLVSKARIWICVKAGKIKAGSERNAGARFDNMVC